MANVVVHIDEENRWEQLLSNIENYSEAHTHSKIEVLINGPAVRFFNGMDVYPEYRKRMKALHAHTVRFLICANSLRNRQIPQDILPSWLEVVPQGFAYLVDRQGEGFAYVKP